MSGTEAGRGGTEDFDSPLSLLSVFAPVSPTELSLREALGLAEPENFTEADRQKLTESLRSLCATRSCELGKGGGGGERRRDGGEDELPEIGSAEQAARVGRGGKYHSCVFHDAGKEKDVLRALFVSALFECDDKGGDEFGAWRHTSRSLLSECPLCVLGQMSLRNRLLRCLEHDGFEVEEVKEVMRQDEIDRITEALTSFSPPVDTNGESPHEGPSLRKRGEGHSSELSSSLLSQEMEKERDGLSGGRGKRDGKSCCLFGRCTSFDVALFAFFVDSEFLFGETAARGGEGQEGAEGGEVIDLETSESCLFDLLFRLSDEASSLSSSERDTDEGVEFASSLGSAVRRLIEAGMNSSADFSVGHFDFVQVVMLACGCADWRVRRLAEDLLVLSAVPPVSFSSGPPSLLSPSPPHLFGKKEGEEEEELSVGGGAGRKEHRLRRVCWLSGSDGEESEQEEEEEGKDARHLVEGGRPKKPMEDLIADDPSKVEVVLQIFAQRLKDCAVSVPRQAPGEKATGRASTFPSLSYQTLSACACLDILSQVVLRGRWRPSGAAWAARSLVLCGDGASAWLRCALGVDGYGLCLKGEGEGETETDAAGGWRVALDILTVPLTRSVLRLGGLSEPMLSASPADVAEAQETVANCLETGQEEGGGWLAEALCACFDDPQLSFSRAETAPERERERKKGGIRGLRNCAAEAFLSLVCIRSVIGHSARRRTLLRRFLSLLSQQAVRASGLHIGIEARGLLLRGDDGESRLRVLLGVLRLLQAEADAEGEGQIGDDAAGDDSVQIEADEGSERGVWKVDSLVREGGAWDSLAEFLKSVAQGFSCTDDGAIEGAALAAGGDWGTLVFPDSERAPLAPPLFRSPNLRASIVFAASSLLGSVLSGAAALWRHAVAPLLLSRLRNERDGKGFAYSDGSMGRSVASVEAGERKRVEEMLWMRVPAVADALSALPDLAVTVVDSLYRAQEEDAGGDGVEGFDGSAALLFSALSLFLSPMLATSALAVAGAEAKGHEGGLGVLVTRVSLDCLDALFLLLAVALEILLSCGRRGGVTRCESVRAAHRESLQRLRKAYMQRGERECIFSLLAEEADKRGGSGGIDDGVGGPTLSSWIRSGIKRAFEGQQFPQRMSSVGVGAGEVQGGSDRGGGRVRLAQGGSGSGWTRGGAAAVLSSSSLASRSIECLPLLCFSSCGCDSCSSLVESEKAAQNVGIELVGVGREGMGSFLCSCSDDVWTVLVGAVIEVTVRLLGGPGGGGAGSVSRSASFGVDCGIATSVYRICLSQSPSVSWSTYPTAMRFFLSRAKDLFGSGGGGIGEQEMVEDLGGGGGNLGAKSQLISGIVHLLATSEDALITGGGGSVGGLRLLSASVRVSALVASIPFLLPLLFSFSLSAAHLEPEREESLRRKGMVDDPPVDLLRESRSEMALRLWRFVAEGIESVVRVLGERVEAGVEGEGDFSGRALEQLETNEHSRLGIEGQCMVSVLCLFVRSLKALFEEAKKAMEAVERDDIGVETDQDRDGQKGEMEGVGEVGDIWMGRHSSASEESEDSSVVELIGGDFEETSGKGPKERAALRKSSPILSCFARRDSVSPADLLALLAECFRQLERHPPLFTSTGLVDDLQSCRRLSLQLFSENCRLKALKVDSVPPDLLKARNNKKSGLSGGMQREIAPLAESLPAAPAVRRLSSASVSHVSISSGSVTPGGVDGMTRSKARGGAHGDRGVTEVHVVEDEDEEEGELRDSDLDSDLRIVSLGPLQFPSRGVCRQGGGVPQEGREHSGSGTQHEQLSSDPVSKKVQSIEQGSSLSVGGQRQKKVVSDGGNDRETAFDRGQSGEGAGGDGRRRRSAAGGISLSRGEIDRKRGDNRPAVSSAAFAVPAPGVSRSSAAAAAAAAVSSLSGGDRGGTGGGPSGSVIGPKSSSSSSSSVSLPAALVRAAQGLRTGVGGSQQVGSGVADDSFKESLLLHAAQRANVDPSSLVSLSGNGKGGTIGGEHFSSSMSVAGKFKSRSEALVLGHQSGFGVRRRANAQSGGGFRFGGGRNGGGGKGSSIIQRLRKEVRMEKQVAGGLGGAASGGQPSAFLVDRRALARQREREREREEKERVSKEHEKKPGVQIPPPEQDALHGPRVAAVQKERERERGNRVGVTLLNQGVMPSQLRNLASTSKPAAEYHQMSQQQRAEARRNAQQDVERMLLEVVHWNPFSQYAKERDEEELMHGIQQQGNGGGEHGKGRGKELDAAPSQAEKGEGVVAVGACRREEGQKQGRRPFEKGRIPSEFQSPEDFRKVFGPLVLEECRASLISASLERRLEGRRVRFLSVERHSKWQIADVMPVEEPKGERETDTTPLPIPLALDLCLLLPAPPSTAATVNTGGGARPPQGVARKSQPTLPIERSFAEEIEGCILSELSPPSCDFIVAVCDSDKGPYEAVSEGLRGGGGGVAGDGSRRRAPQRLRLRFLDTPLVLSHSRGSNQQRHGGNLPRGVMQTSVLRCAGSEWVVFSLASLTTAVREFQALYFSGFSPLFHKLLRPSLHRPKMEADYEKTAQKQREKEACLAAAVSSTVVVPRDPWDTVFDAQSLNSSQRVAVRWAFQSPSGISLTQGPPGTGKTKTILAIIAVFLGRLRSLDDAAATAAGATAKAGEGKGNAAAENRSRSTSSSSSGVRPTRPKLLVCAPSNAAVDELACRILSTGLQRPSDSAHGSSSSSSSSFSSSSSSSFTNRVETFRPKCVRVGAPRQITRDEVRAISLDLHTREKEREILEVRKAPIEGLKAKLGGVRRQLEAVAEQLEAAEAGRQGGGCLTGTDVEEGEVRMSDEDAAESAQSLRAQKKELTVEKKKLQESLQNLQATLKEDEGRAEISKKAKQILLMEADLIFATLSGAGSEVLWGPGAPRIAAAIVDEAAQAVELSTLIPLRHGIRALVLVGDPQQLPATVLSKENRAAGYDRSLFRRLEEAGVPVHMLSKQYRMRPKISAFPRAFFYEGKLEDAEETQTRGVLGLFGAPGGIFGELRFFNLVAAERRGRSLSVSNDAEAEFVARLVSALSTLPLSVTGIALTDIVVLTPYREQANLIRRKLVSVCGCAGDAVDICTVDSFQGRERKCVIFSCVRSSLAAARAAQERRAEAVAADRLMSSLGGWGSFESPIAHRQTSSSSSGRHMSLSSVSRGLPSFLFDSGVRGRKGNEREKEGRGDTSLQSQQQQPDSQNPKLRSLNRCPTASTPARLTSHGEGNRGATGQAVSASASVSPLTTVCRGRSGRTVSSSGAFSSAEAKMMQSRQEQQSLGFLADTRRLNVAVTRARDALWVVGSSPVLVSHRAFKKLIAYAKYVGGFVDVASWAASGPQRGPGPRDSAALSEKAQVASFWRSANIRLKEWEKSPEVQQQQQQEKEERELVNKKPREGSSVRERAGEDGRENKRPSAAVGSQKDLQEGVRVDLKRKRKIPEGGETERFEGTLPPEREHRKEKAPLFVQGQGKGEGKGNGKEALESVGQKRPFPFSSVDPPAAGGTLPPRDIREGQVDRAQRDRHEGGLGSPGGKQNHAVGSLALERERKKVKLLPSSDISQSDLQASSSSSSSSLPRMGERGVSAAGGGAVMPARPNAERRRTKLVPPRVPNVGGPLSLRGIPPPPLSGASVPATSSRLVSSRRGAEGVRETTSEGLSAEIRPSAHSHHPHAPAPAVQMQGAQTKKRGRDADPRARPTATAAIAAAAAVDFSSFAFSSSPPSSASVFHSQSHSQSQSFPQSLPAPVRPRSQRDGEQIQRERGNQHPGQVAAGAAATGGEREAGRGGREERRKVKLIGASRPPSLPFPLSAQGQSRPPNHGGSVTSIPPQRRQRVTQGDPTPITQTQIQAQAHTRARAAVSHPPPVTGSSSSHSQGRPPSRAAEALSERPSQTAQPPERPFRRPS